MGGGGGNAGKVDFPDYLKAVHTDWLTKNTTYDIDYSMTYLMNAGFDNNPYTTAMAYNPDVALAAMITAGNLVQALVTSLSGAAPIATSVTAINNALSGVLTLSGGLATNVPIADMVSDILSARDDLIDVIDDLKTIAPLSTIPGGATGLINQINTVHSSFTPVVSSVLYDNYTDDVIAEFASETANRLETNIIPRYNAGMRNIGAVVSSSFAIGRSLIEAEQDREVGTFSAQLYLKSASDDALKLIASKLEFQRLVSDNLMKLVNYNIEGQTSVSTLVSSINSNLLKARSDTQTVASSLESSVHNDLIKTNISGQETAAHLIADINRIKIVAKGEQAGDDLDIDLNDALWDIELYQGGAALLGALGGGTHVPRNKSNRTASTLGGGLSGAAMGGLSGAKAGASFSWPGAIIGGVLGAAAGYLSSS